MIDKRMLVDTVTIQKPAELDGWGKQTYSDPVTLKHVRFDRSTAHTGSGHSPRLHHP